jgi:cystathionine beta-lyase
MVDWVFERIEKSVGTARPLFGRQSRLHFNPRYNPAVNSNRDIDLDISLLRHPDSVKWMHYPPDVLALWVADMDFDIAPSIRAALIERCGRPLGYHIFNDPLLPLLREKLHRTGFPTIPDRGIAFISGVVQGLFASVLGLTQPGEDVMTMTPIYPPFLWAIQRQNRGARLPRLKDTPQGWQIDFDAMESAITPTTRLLMICHPHNPTGRVWNVDELREIANFADRHQLFVVSDELHADLTLDGPFVPFVSIAPPQLQMRTVTLTGPCKTYNTAGLGIGAMISHNPDLIEKLKKSLYGIGGHPSTMSFTMWRAALRDDGQWLSTVLEKLRANRQLLHRFVTERLPSVRISPPEATYLAWLDYRAHPKSAEIQKYLLDTAKVALNPGPDFGPGNEGYVRLNFATSPAILQEALDRLASCA